MKKCPKCECRHFENDRRSIRSNSTIRRMICRNCGTMIRINLSPVEPPENIPDQTKPQLTIETGSGVQEL